LVRDLGEVV
jgi:hypothetical protein